MAQWTVGFFDCAKSLEAIGAASSTVEQANAFLNERYIAEFNDKFTVPAKRKGQRFGAPRAAI